MASRQREWQIKMAEKGLCSICGDKAVRKGYCQVHYERKQERTRRWWEKQKTLAHGAGE